MSERWIHACGLLGLLGAALPFAGLAGAAGMVGCAAGDTALSAPIDADGTDKTPSIDQPDTEPRAGRGASDADVPVGPGPDAPLDPDGDALVDGDGDSGGGRVSIGSGGLPCDVDAVLATSFRGCHGKAPGAQAPMALVSHGDLMAPAVSQPDKAVYELIKERVHLTGAGQMPPPGRGRPLTDAELATLDAWIDGDQPQGTCEPEPLPVTDTITYEPPGEDEIEACYKLYAHQNPVPGDSQPFLARTGEYYTAFYFDVPWEGEKQAILFRSSDSDITHHWLLYDTPEPLPDGTVLDNTTGSHPGAPDLLAAWAINQQREQYMPVEAGLAMPVRGSGRKFLLEVHYFNANAPKLDNSGVEVCVGKTPRPNTATVSWLGSEAIVLLPGSPLDLVGTCTPQVSEDIYIFRSFPHMHEQGYHLKTEIRRADGSMEPLIDKPFDFNNQLMYDTPAVIHPGDQLLTTCRYQNRSDRLIGVGYDSLSEMCFNFVYAWSAKALVGGISLTGTSTPCLL